MKIRWSRLAILVAGLLAVLVLLLAGLSLLAPNLRRILQAPYWKTDAQLAAQAARRMFDYDLPPSYKELKVLTVNGEDAAVMFARTDRPADLIFVETVTGGILDNEEWRARYETSLSREMGEHRYETEEAGSQQATIRGQATTVRIFEGTDETGRPVRQAVCGFAGKSGDLLLGIVAGENAWDQAMVDAFLRSIR